MESEITDGPLFRDSLEKKGLKESTIEMYADVVDQFLVKYAIVDDLDLYNTFLKEHIFDKRSYYYYFSIRMFIKWKIKDVAKRNLILRNLIKPRNEFPVKNSIYLSPQKREQVINYIENPMYKLIFKIQNQTGARIGDILRLKRGAISFEDCNGKLSMKFDIIGKRGKKNSKWIFDRDLQNEIIKFIENTYLDDSYYFIDFTEKHFSTSSETVVMRTVYNRCWCDLKKACAKAGVDPKMWSTHDFRRSISRDIWNHPELGKDLKLLQDFLGHTDIRSTAIYLQRSGFTNQEVAMKLAKQNRKI